MKSILLFGAGKSATILIDYLKDVVTTNQWRLTVADSDIKLALSKVGHHHRAKAVFVNIDDAPARKKLVQSADIVISMLPPALHYLIALDCIEYSKHLLTASYVDGRIKSEEQNIKNKNILFLCEMGLDPGIDHMSAMRLIDQIKKKGGKISSFKSHCGGLIAPENDTNPWHYKISWNPRNVVLAGKDGATFKELGQIKNIEYPDVFKNCPIIELNTLGKFASYPNRNSLSYITVYGLEDAATFVRTTLRYPAFCNGWKYVVDWKLTDEVLQYETNNLTIASFFKQHFERFHLSNVLSILKRNTALNKQFENLGLYDNETLINKGFCSAAAVLQFILETKWVLKPEDKDLIAMLHEIEYTASGSKWQVNSELVVKGTDSLHTAMAKSVGLPLGIAAKLILEGKITETGLHIPIIAGIYEPVLKELAEHGILFSETVSG
jgi:saccharopine dehydrogenase (NADP+, L-glutamate forming)